MIAVLTLMGEEADMTVRRILTFVILVFSIASGQSVPADRSAKQPTATEKKSAKESPNAHLWEERARLFAAELDQDSAQLSASEAATVNALMSRTWWKLDPSRSQQLRDRAVELVTHIPDNESQDERKQRLDAGFEVVRIITPMVDPADVRRITADLTKGATDARNIAEAKMRERRAFERAVNEEEGRGNPEIAAKLIADWLKNGNGLSGMSMVNMLRFRDPELADRVFRQALEALPALNYDPDTIACLVWDAFRLSVRVPNAPPGESKGPSEGLKKALLQAVAQSVLHVPQNDGDRENICKDAEQVSVLSDKFSQQQWAAMQAVADGCQSEAQHDPRVRTRKAPPPPDCSGGSQECLRMAETEPDADWRAMLLREAFSIAAEKEKNPELAVTIYKSLSEEERRSNPTLLLSLLDPYDELGGKYLQSGDPGPFYSMLRDAPDELRPRLQLMFADEMLEKEKTPEGLALLTEVRTTLTKNDTPHAELYLQLLNAYARYLPGDAPVVMRECIEGLNRIPYPKSDREAWERGMPTARRINPWHVSLTLLDLDSTFLSASVDSLQVPQWRACFRLGLLQAVLRRNNLEWEGVKSAEQRPAAAK